MDILDDLEGDLQGSETSLGQEAWKHEESSRTLQDADWGTSLRVFCVFVVIFLVILYLTRPLSHKENRDVSGAEP